MDNCKIISPEKITLETNIHLDFVCEIKPKRSFEGNIEEYSFFEQLSDRMDIKFHHYGMGPFCRFIIPYTHWGRSGVYFIFVNNSLCYIGKCVNLESRFNEGYGIIFLKNCLNGGQQTNCRLNHLILERCNENNRVDLFFYEIPSYEEIEARLISSYSPQWNISMTNNTRYFSHDKNSLKLYHSKPTPNKKYGKYAGLGDLLNKSKTNDITLSFSEIDRVVGPLPPSAYKYSAWWANDITHSQAQIWLDLGWKVILVKMGTSVKFSRNILTI